MYTYVLIAEQDHNPLIIACGSKRHVTKLAEDMTPLIGSNEISNFYVLEKYTHKSILISGSPFIYAVDPGYNIVFDDKIYKYKLPLEIRAILHDVNMDDDLFKDMNEFLKIVKEINGTDDACIVCDIIRDISKKHLKSLRILRKALVWRAGDEKVIRCAEKFLKAAFICEDGAEIKDSYMGALTPILVDIIEEKLIGEYELPAIMKNTMLSDWL